MTSAAILTLLALGLPAPAAARAGVLRLADNAIDGSADTLAGRQMEVARYYIGKLDYTAALNRLRFVVTSSSPPAMSRRPWRTSPRGIWRWHPAEAETAVAVLDRKFPNGPWSAKAHAALIAAGFKPIEDERSWISQAFK